MIKDLLFEIDCAEQIGYFKMADQLDQKLLKVASKNYKDVRKSLFKKISKINTASNIFFSPTQQSFIIQVSPEISTKDKNSLKKLAEPFSVKFKYASNNLNKVAKYDFENFNLSDLIDKPSKSGEELELELYNEDKDEPTDEDLRRTEEFPAEDIDETEELLLMLLAKKHLQDLGELPKSDA